MRAFFMIEMKTPLRILEVSIPHASPDGTLRGAMKLPQTIASAGFNTVFVLPWMKINQSLSASPYAVIDHLTVHETIGAVEDSMEWIERCHAAGLRVVLDMPLNHTSPMHHWASNPQWFLRDAAGMPHPPAGTTWNDVVQLNHHCAELVQACEEVLLHWLKVGVDGFRFDAASFIPDAVLIRWSERLLQQTTVPLLLWCDGSEYARQRPFFDGYLNHEAFQLAKHSMVEWEEHVRLSEDSGIFYLSSHDTLQNCCSPMNEWPEHYEAMKMHLERSAQHWLLSWSDWQNPQSYYSFLLHS
jgi:glycosidase